MGIAVPSVVCTSCIDGKLDFLRTTEMATPSLEERSHQLAAELGKWAYACTLLGVFIGADGDAESAVLWRWLYVGQLCTENQSKAKETSAVGSLSQALRDCETEKGPSCEDQREKRDERSKMIFFFFPFSYFGQAQLPV